MTESHYDNADVEDGEDCICQNIYLTCNTAGNVKCTLNCLNRIMIALKRHKWNEILSYKFLKIRHNFFADCFMMDNDIEIRGTDFKLSNLGIDSNLSPDIYLGQGVDGVHKFIEFFVSANSEIALNNKISKYSEIDGISVQYVYYDYRLMKVFSEPEMEISELSGMEMFTSFIRSSYKVDRYIKYNSEELDISNITDGLKLAQKDQNIYYSQNYNEYTMEEYGKSIKTIMNKLASIPEEKGVSIHFDCKTRRFKIESGKYDAFWMYKTVQRDDLMRNIVVYDNSESVCSELAEDDEYNQNENNIGDGHKLDIVVEKTVSPCLEKAETPEYIEDQIFKLDYEGLYSKNLSPAIICKESDDFYDSWINDCRTIRSVKLKMTTMLPIPDPDRIDCKMGEKFRGLSRFNSFIISSIPKTPSEFSPIGKPSARVMESDKIISKNKLEIDRIDAGLKAQRKIMIDRMGANGASMKIKNMTDCVKSAIRSVSGRDWTVDMVLSRAQTNYNDALTQSDLDYMKDIITKTRIMRKTRRMMKQRISRTNMITLDRENYKLYEQEKQIYLHRRNKGEERMGLNGYDGEITFQQLEEMFFRIWEYFVEDSTVFEDWFSIDCTEKSFPDTVPGKQCLDYFSYYQYSRDKYRKTRIYRVILWMSRLCRSIWAISTYKLKKRRIVFDKFGTKSCILLVGSTGNIQKYKSSKCFKIIFPINPQVKRFCGYDRIPGFEIFRDENNNEYASTHWSYLKIDHLKYFMELPSRWTQTVSCLMSEYSVQGIDDKLIMYLTYCCLNARRKNENLLHDLKYMTYNLFGLKGSYRELLEDKFEIPRDMLQRYIEEKFLRNIPEFVESLNKNQLYSISPTGSYPSYRLKHPLSDREGGLDYFNLFVYSSYIFPKGVFTHEIEQSKNMESIMSIHEKVDKLFKGACDYQSVKRITDVPISQIFNEDMNYNSGVVSAIGLYCEHYLTTRGSNFDIRGDWAEIINTDITEYANSHGLRENDLSQKKSWGKKGHDVMTMLISKERSSAIPEQFENIDPSNIKEYSKAKYKINSTKFRVMDYAKSHPLKNIELNNANKVQWGGSREIYIMTIGAKNIQWALEQMFSKIARNIENELIHVPASLRFSKLYDNIKGDVRGIRYYLTLDCRKWAPLSNLNKYLIFVNSMAGVLPEEFVEDFNYFFTLYYSKRLYFKSEDVINFMRINNNTRYSEYFIKDGDAFYIEMPYSFMMGMFNYLSSILHAAAQLYFIDNIIPIIEKRMNCKIKMRMFAHSDDSGGYIEISNSKDTEEVLNCVLKEYEAFQKCANHMLSLKKCTVSTSYFEITSYCFMKTDPMPVLSKFIYNSQINLTPVGYLSDVKSISSSVIEMITNGSSFRTAFIKYIILGNLYRKMCMNRCLDDSSSVISMDLGGYPLMHPFYMMVYRSFSEMKWLSEFGTRIYSKNQSILENMGMIDPWGRRNSMKMRMVSMKERENDGRFKGYETLSELPDEIIPSGHYLCYMRKMCNKYYSDVMWYSMHDIDGLLIQSNFFNYGASQIYTFYGVECTIPELIEKVKAVFALNCDMTYKISLPEYIEQIDKFIKDNKNVLYKDSEFRAKPCEMNTYYNKWWRNNMRETKIMALIKTCKWMAVLISNPNEYINCLDSSENIDLCDIMYNLSEPEPLMQMMMTTRSESRLIDRFEKIGSWMFYNNVPYMQPIDLKYCNKSYNIPGSEIHSQCLASLIFYSVSSGKVRNPNDIEVKQIQGDEVRISSAMNILMKRSCDDPICLMVQGRTRSEWMNRVDFVAMLNNQMFYNRSWRGSALCIARISGREYELMVNNGRIMTVKCKSRYDINNIVSDMGSISAYWFDFTPNVSNYKIKKIERITRSPSGNWHWTASEAGCPYYENIILDESISTLNNLEFIVEDISSQKKKMKTVGRPDPMETWYKCKLKYKYQGKRYKAYIVGSKPCERCLEQCYCKGANFKTGSKITYNIDCPTESLINRWSSTKSYSLLYKEMAYSELFEDSARYVGQIGTILSAIYNGDNMLSEMNYLADYKDELIPTSLTTMECNISLINEIKAHLGKFVKFRIRAGKVECQSDPEKVRALMSEYGEQTVSTALALLPVERSMNYYTPMTFDDFWYNNQQILPQFLCNTLRYLSSTIGKQQGSMSHKKKVYKAIIDEFLNYLSTTYVLLTQNNYLFTAAFNLKLYWMLKEFKDVGDPADETIDQMYYYDPISIMGCTMGWLRYCMAYSYRKNGKLTPGYQRGYKMVYAAFVKKYKSFCQDSLQVTPQQRDLTGIKTLSIPCVDYCKSEESEPGYIKPYPLAGCHPDDYSQDPEDFDDEIMTYDREESMVSYRYDPDQHYDYANLSIFYNEGDSVDITMCNQDEACNWVPQQPYEGGEFKVSRGGGVSRIVSDSGRFKTGWSGNQNSYSKYEDYISNNLDSLGDEDLLTFMTENINMSSKYKFKSGEFIEIKGTNVKSTLALLYGALSKYAVFNSVFDVKGNLTPILEGQNYERISNSSKIMNDSMFDQEAIAEFEKISPGIIKDMETDCYRLTEQRYNLIKELETSYIYKNTAIGYTVKRMISSALIVESDDKLCERTSDRIVSVIHSCGQKITATRDEALIEPSYTGNIYKTVTIGI